MKRFYLIDQNQTDARYTMNETGVCQTITARCGTGGGHVPMVIISNAEAYLFYNDRRRADYHQAEDHAPSVVAKYGTGG